MATDAAARLAVGKVRFSNCAFRASCCSTLSARKSRKSPFMSLALPGITRIRLRIGLYQLKDAKFETASEFGHPASIPRAHHEAADAATSIGTRGAEIKEIRTARKRVENRRF